MPREDGLPPPPHSEAVTPPASESRAGAARRTTPGLVLLERLVALADRAIEAARGGDMDAVNALLDEREPFLAQLTSALAQRPGAPSASASAPPDRDDLPSVASEARLAELARRDLDAMALLERGIAEARISVAGELDAITAAQATVYRYADDSPTAPPAGTIDIRR